MSLLTGLAVLALALQTPPSGPAPADTPPQGVTTGTDRESAVHIQISGHLDLHYLYRSPQIDEAGAVLNNLPSAGPFPDDFWAGRISLRTDIDVKDFVSGVVELENRSFERGENKPFSFNNPDAAIIIRQGYIQVGQFLSPEFDVRIGVQNLTLRNRPQDEPFFMDLGESEGFFRGYQPAGRFISNTVDREIGQATGVRFFYSPWDFGTVQAFWMDYGDGGTNPTDETIYGAVVNSLLGENWSSWILLVGVKGNGDQLGLIETVGAGLDGYLGDSKELELFGELYGQRGTLVHAPDAVQKEAYAFNVGARWLGFWSRQLWVEVALSRRSGTRHPGDGHDQAFQSYENVNRFLILESSEFGLDVDTNVSCARAAVGLGPFEVLRKPFRIQLDVGRFAAVAPIASAPVAGDAREWGTESDLSFVWDYNDSFSLFLKGAGLFHSELMDRLGGDSHAWLIVFGADLKF